MTWYIDDVTLAFGVVSLVAVLGCESEVGLAPYSNSLIAELDPISTGEVWDLNEQYIFGSVDSDISASTCPSPPADVQFRGPVWSFAGWDLFWSASLRTEDSQIVEIGRCTAIYCWFCMWRLRCVGEPLNCEGDVEGLWANEMVPIVDNLDFGSGKIVVLLSRVFGPWVLAFKSDSIGWISLISGDLLFTGELLRRWWVSSSLDLVDIPKNGGFSLFRDVWCLLLKPLWEYGRWERLAHSRSGFGLPYFGDTANCAILLLPGRWRPIVRLTGIIRSWRIFGEVGLWSDTEWLSLIVCCFSVRGVVELRFSDSPSPPQVVLGRIVCSSLFVFGVTDRGRCSFRRIISAGPAEYGRGRRLEWRREKVGPCKKRYWRSRTIPVICMRKEER